MKAKAGFGIGLLFVALLGSGCSGLKVRPDSASIVIPKVQGSIPVSVGITRTEQKVSGGLVSETFPDLSPIFKKHLEESGLFEKVYHPTRPTIQTDAELALHLNAQFKADGGLGAKAFLTGFFMLLPTPLVWYHHKYHAECTLDVMQGGRKLKTYSASAKVVVSHQLFSLGRTDFLEAEGTQATAKLLCARLIEQLEKDRAFLENELKTRKAAPAQ